MSDCDQSWDSRIEMLENDIEKHTQQVALTKSMRDVTMMFFEEQSSEMNEKEKQMLDGVKKSYIEHFDPVIKSMQDENTRMKLMLGELQQQRTKQFQLLQNLSRSFMSKGPEVSEGQQGLEVSEEQLGHRGQTGHILVYVIKDFGWSFNTTLSEVITSVQQQMRRGSPVHLNPAKDTSFVHRLFRGVEEGGQITYVIRFLTNSGTEKIRIRIHSSQDEDVKSEIIRRLHAKCGSFPF